MEHTKHLEIVLHKGVLLKHPFVEWIKARQDKTPRWENDEKLHCIGYIITNQLHSRDTLKN